MKKSLKFVLCGCYGNYDMSNTGVGYFGGQSFHDFLGKRPA